MIVLELAHINPYVRAVEVQPAVLEGEGQRYAYDYRLFFILEGSGEIVTEDRFLAIDSDSAIFIPPEIGYRFVGKMKVVVVNFDISRAGECKQIPICPPLRQAFRRELLFDTARSKHLAEPMIHKDATLLREMFLDIVKAWNAGSLWRDAATSAAVKQILVRMLQAKTDKRDPNKELCNRIRAYIYLHAAEDITNRTLSEQFGYHPVYLGTLFRNTTGQTLHDAILTERVRLACKWLTQTDEPIEEIAYATGFSSRSHFYTVFRKQLGISPLSYRTAKRRLS